MRALIIAHGHPDLSTGGGEIAAYRHCQELRQRGWQVLFIARAPTAGDRGGTPFSVRADNPHDVLFHSPDFDFFLLSQRGKWSIYEEFRSLLENFKPDIVHIHHYIHMGLEMIHEIRKYSDTIPILMTLHEYMAICNNFGQMMKTDARMCNSASSLDCHLCFPTRSPQDFFMRELFIKSFFSKVDMFVSPSRFLLERYVRWGIDRNRITVIENGQPVAAGPEAEPPVDPVRLCRRFAFFGQISKFKGIFVLLEAVRKLPKNLKKDIQVTISGSMQYEDDHFKAEFHDAVKAAGRHVRYSGPYRPGDLPGLMRNVGWTVVPSIWWENSPLVIQESLNHRRPVICSDIGGMAEKVRDGGTGLHFRVGDALDLADRMEEAADPELWRRLHSQIQAPPTIVETTDEHVSIYQRLLNPDRAAAVPKNRAAD